MAKNDDQARREAKAKAAAGDAAGKNVPKPEKAASKKKK